MYLVELDNKTKFFNLIFHNIIIREINFYPGQRLWVKRKIINKNSESLYKDFTDELGLNINQRIFYSILLLVIYERLISQLILLLLVLNQLESKFSNNMIT